MITQVNMTTFSRKHRTYVLSVGHLCLYQDIFYLFVHAAARESQASCADCSRACVYFGLLVELWIRGFIRSSTTNKQ